MTETISFNGSFNFIVNKAEDGQILSISIERKKPQPRPVTPYMPENRPSKQSVEEVTSYIEALIENRESGESWWLDDQGQDHSCDVGYGIEFVELLIEELKRVCI